MSSSLPRYDTHLADQAKAIFEGEDDDDFGAQANAHAIVIKQHRAFFLKESFCIDIHGAPLDNAHDCFPYKHKKVKTVDLYNDMVRVLSNWGDSDALASAADDDLDAIATYCFQKQNPKGYNYSRDFKVDDAENLDGTAAKILVHKKNGKVVLHMLDVFDIIMEAHWKAGHLAVERTKTMAEATYYSVTAELVKINCNQCFVCMQKTLRVSTRKGAKKPIISSEF
jgi:hypothetical protein